MQNATVLQRSNKLNDRVLGVLVPKWNVLHAVVGAFARQPLWVPVVVSVLVPKWNVLHNVGGVFAPKRLFIHVVVSVFTPKRRFIIAAVNAFVRQLLSEISPTVLGIL